MISGRYKISPEDMAPCIEARIGQLYEDDECNIDSPQETSNFTVMEELIVIKESNSQKSELDR